MFIYYFRINVAPADCVLFSSQNLSMQMILATDGMYTYLMFNYDQEEFSIQPEAYITLSSGYTYPDNLTGEILSNRTTFMNLKNGSNVYPRRTK